MGILFYILLFSTFIIVSNFIVDFTEEKTMANVKATAVSVGAILFIMLISRIVYFFGVSFLKNTTGIIISYCIDCVIPIGLTVSAIYCVSKTFRYHVAFPKWMLIVTIASALVICPLYLIYTKATLSYMDMLTSGNGITQYSLASGFSSIKYYGILISLITKIPAVILAAFLAVKRKCMNRNT